MILQVVFIFEMPGNTHKTLLQYKLVGVIPPSILPVASWTGKQPANLLSPPAAQLAVSHHGIGEPATL